MSPDEKDLSDLEQTLAGLRPAPAGFDRDQVMFQAGRAAAHGPRRLLWPAATGLMTAVAACLGLFLLLRPDAEPAVRFVYIDRPVSDQPPTPPESPAPRPAPEREAATAPAAMAALSYWQLQEIAARHGVESLPEQRAPAAAGPAPVAATTSVWQGHSRPTMASSFFHAGVE